MDRPVHPLTDTSFGGLLRHWRGQRALSQLALALSAEVSARHLSWLETGKSEPSRAMVLRLAERLDLPQRERNALLAAAGYAPLYRQSPFDGAVLAPARAVLQQLLNAHEPAPALAVDRHWNLLASNRLVPLLLQGLPAALTTPPVNVLRATLHPQGLAPQIVNLPAWRGHVLARLQRQVASTGDGQLARLFDELRALPAPKVSPVTPHTEDVMPTPACDDWVVPLTLHTPLGTLNFITTVTVFGAPHDVTLSEVAVETLLPADAATAAALRALLATAS